MNKKKNTLHVLYTSKAIRIPCDALLLSFMSPREEQSFTPLFPGFLSGRKEMNAIREKARRAYIDLVARIGATPRKGRTLRQSLGIKNKGNPWWYHKITEKEAETDDTFNMILQIFTILQVAEIKDIDNIVICGAPVEVSRVLASRYKIKAIKCVLRLKTNFFMGLLSRLIYLYKNLYLLNVLQRNISLPELSVCPGIVFQGFWNRSIQVNMENNKLEDGYFKELPEYIMAQGINCAWFLWLDSYRKPASKGKPLYDILSPARGNQQLIFVQKFLKSSDILSAILDFHPFRGYMKYSRGKEFRNLFKEEGCNFWPLLSGNLLYNFSDSTLSHYYLMETACRRAFAFYKPKLAFTFLELFLSSRAFYQGAKFGNPATVMCNMQHASYGREKTFILLDPDRELLGKPDNIAMPVPDYFFAMGELYRDILLENGVLPEKIFLTGSARYDHIKVSNITTDIKSKHNILKVLLAPTLNLGLDFEMIQAAFLAAQELNIKLHLRSHPLARIEDMPSYKPYREFITSSAGTLEEDLQNSDVVLFTYSTVAEEAFLKGIPILQWQVLGFNGSVFRDLGIVPNVCSIEELKSAFESLIYEKQTFIPRKEFQDIVLRKCFHKADGQASKRISEKLVKIPGLYATLI